MTKGVDPKILAALVDPEALYQDAPCGYFSFLPDGTIIKINNTLLNWIGLKREDIEHQLAFGDLISQGGRIYYELFYLPSIRLQGYVNEVSFDVKNSDGSTFPALFNAKGVKDKEGHLIAVNATVYNITDRKKYETELLNAKQLAEAEKMKFEFLSDFIPEMIWTANADGRINYVNKRFTDHFKLGKGQVDEILNLLNPEDRLTATEMWTKTVKEQSNFQLQVRFKNHLEEYQWYLLKAIPFKDTDGPVSKWLGSCLNINAHVLELERRDEFLSMASHELKTPITSLKALLQILNRANEAEMPVKFQGFIRQADRSMEKIITLVDDMLNVKQLKSGHLQLRKTRFNVADMIRSSLASINTDENFQMEITGDMEAAVDADEHRIEQVVVNFVNNAIKYAPQSRVIELKIEQNFSTVKISVTDQGPGIPPDKLAHLFERYYQANKKGTQYSGLGLGLYISTEIIERHNGKIGVESQLGAGSTFWFTLPVS